MAATTDSIKADARDRMQKAIAAAHRDLATIRTGKASVALLDAIRVPYYGNPVPLNQVASISAPEPRLLMVQPWEKPLAGEIVKAIQKAELGLNPLVEGNVIRIPIPALNEERRKEMVKLVRKHAEECRVAVRNIRRDANEHLKKSEKEKHVSEDETHRAADEIQKFTDTFIAEIDKIVTAKEAEVMEV